MRRLPLLLAGAIILVSPFREGGRDPLALLVLHTLALAYVVMIAPGAARGAGHGAGWTRREKTIAGLLLGGVALALGSAWRAAYPLAAGLGAWDLVVPAGLFIAALRAGPGGAPIVRLRDLTVLSTGLQALLVLARFGHGGPMAAAASFLNPNQLAAFLNVGLLLCAAAAGESWERGDRRPCLAWGAVGSLHLAAIILISSRGALLGLVTALALLGWLRRPSWTRRGFLASVVVGALVVTLAGGMIARRFRRWDDPYRYQRLSIWNASLGMLAERPLLGFGPGMFRHVSARFNFPIEEGPIRFGRTFQSAHSAVLTLAVEDGAPALLAFLGAAVLAAAAAAWAGGALGPSRAAVRGAGLAAAALLAHGLVDDLQERTALTLVPALLLGAALAACRENGGETAGRDAPAPTPTSASPAPPRAAGGLALRCAIGLAAAYLLTGAIVRPYLAHREAQAALRAGRAGLPRLERAARCNPLQPEYRHDLAMAALNSGPPSPPRYAESAIHLLAAERLKPIDYRFPLLLGRLESTYGGRLFDDAGAARRAAAHYARAARLAPRDPRPHLEFAGFLSDQGRLEEALVETGLALRLEPNFVRVRILEGTILLRLGRREEAAAALRALEQSRKALASYLPDSGYAREIVADNPPARERLEAGLAGQAVASKLHRGP